MINTDGLVGDGGSCFDCNVFAIEVNRDGEAGTIVSDSWSIGTFMIFQDEITAESIVEVLDNATIASDSGLFGLDVLFRIGDVSAEDITLHEEDGLFEFAIWLKPHGGGYGEINILRVEIQKCLQNETGGVN